MIGLDTNILVRFFMQDDANQYNQALSVLETLSAEAPGWIGLAAIMELIWVLTSIYKTTRPDVLLILNHLLSRKEIVIEQVEVIHHAARMYRETSVGFSDCLISASAHAAGCDRTLTFDRQAAKSVGMTLVS